MRLGVNVRTRVCEAHHYLHIETLEYAGHIAHIISLNLLKTH